MYFLTLEGFYLSEFCNPDQAFFSDRFDDRLHFLTLDEVVAVGQSLRGLYGPLGVAEESRDFVFAYLSQQIDQIYRDVFPVESSRCRYHPDRYCFEWEIDSTGRTDRINLHLEEFSICFNPCDEVQLFIGLVNGKIKQIWNGLEHVFLDPHFRTEIEGLTLHLWSVSQQYKETLKQNFQRARSRY